MSEDQSSEMEEDVFAQDEAEFEKIFADMAIE